MKKIFYLFSILLITFTVSSCKEELENWYSETASIDGRYVISTTCEEYSSDNTTIEDGLELMFYNSAANVGNEIWLDTHVAGEHIKSKFKISGNFSSFKGNETVANIASETYLIDTDYGLAPFTSDYVEYFRVPTAAGQLNDGIQLYTRVTFEQAKILPGAATTIGGNVSDSVFVKTVLHSDLVKFESYQLPKEFWENPEVPEFEWRIKKGSNTPAPAEDWDEHWTLSGYRFTGMPEDMAH